MAHKELGYKFENDWTQEETQQVLDNIVSATVVPVNAEIKADQTVLNFDRVKKYVKDAKRIAVIDCDCRTKRKHCEAPVNTCLVFNDSATKYLSDKKYEYKHVRELTSDQAVEVLRLSSEAGLIHMAYLYKGDEGKVNNICSCCSCCCEIFGGILRYGLAPHLLKPSGTTTMDESKCTDCGICSDRCQFGARKMVDNSLMFDNSLCFGCGLCVSTCPTQAISLLQKN